MKHLTASSCIVGTQRMGWQQPGPWPPGPPPCPCLPLMLQCSGAFVSEMVGRFRSMPGRYQSLLDLQPCDLFRQIRNRTLWIVGDSNAQRYYKQLSCFLSPFLWPAGQNVHDRFTYDRNYVEVSCCWLHLGAIWWPLWLKHLPRSLLA